MAQGMIVKMLPYAGTNRIRFKGFVSAYPIEEQAPLAVIITNLYDTGQSCKPAKA